MEYFIVGVLFSPFIMAGAVLLWAGSMLLLDNWRCRHPNVDLADRLLPFEPRSIADEAHEWLRSRSD
jgi:hypothetical protein